MFILSGLRALVFGLGSYMPSKRVDRIKYSLPKIKDPRPKAKDHAQKKAEAGDPRNRLPPSQLGSPYL
jgi:hypothetical protein